MPLTPRFASTRADELLGFLRLAGSRGLTDREMDTYMPRRSWERALADLEQRRELLLTIERREPRPPRYRRTWVRAVLSAELPSLATPEPTVAEAPAAPDPQTSLFDLGRDAA